MNKIKVKVCGITRLRDAEALDRAGVDYLGFNFYPGSPRYIAPAKVAHIISRLKFATPVGVFVDEDRESLLSICRDTGLRWVQLHGKENTDYIQNIPLNVIKAIPVSSGSIPLRDNAGVHYVLFDTAVGKKFGGTGLTFDWKELADYSGAPFFLAGGLGPDNLKEALSHCSPYAVDLNSQVEIEPGVKDIKKVESCLYLLREGN